MKDNALLTLYQIASFHGLRTELKLSGNSINKHAFFTSMHKILYKENRRKKFHHPMYVPILKVI